MEIATIKRSSGRGVPPGRIQWTGKDLCENDRILLGGILIRDC